MCNTTLYNTQRNKYNLEKHNQILRPETCHNITHRLSTWFWREVVPRNTPEHSGTDCY